MDARRGRQREPRRRPTVGPRAQDPAVDRRRIDQPTDRVTTVSERAHRQDVRERFAQEAAVEPTSGSRGIHCAPATGPRQLGAPMNDPIVLVLTRGVYILIFGLT